MTVLLEPLPADRFADWNVALLPAGLDSFNPRARCLDESAGFAPTNPLMLTQVPQA